MVDSEAVLPHNPPRVGAGQMNEGLRWRPRPPRVDEGRRYRRNASGSWQQALIRRSPNRATCMTFC